jgi:hypothetical protein
MSKKPWVSAIVVVIAGLTGTGRTSSIGLLQSVAPVASTHCERRCGGGLSISLGGLDIYENGGSSPNLTAPMLLIFARPDQTNLTPFSSSFISLLTSVSSFPASAMMLWNGGSPPDGRSAGNRQQVYSFINLNSPLLLETPTSDLGIYGLTLNAKSAGSGLIDVGFEWELPQGGYAVAYGQSAGQVFRAPFFLEPKVVLPDLDTLFPDRPCAVPGGSDCSPPGKINNRLQLKSRGLVSPELNEGRLTPELDDSQ